ncbi:MAG TPA: HEAT repeat domain-containing protein [Dissulfurispiraceae bacterium]|nr:HEAT repeat domain-containing protein [Dissulfurispiraceae bacterium]
MPWAVIVKEREGSMTSEELKQMIFDHMDLGFLDNIIDMLRADEKLIPLITDMLQDERMRVRLGATALVEELTKTHSGRLAEQIPALAELLKFESPTVRGDAAYVLGMLRDDSALPFLEERSEDENESVREVILEAIAEIKGKVM